MNSAFLAISLSLNLLIVINCFDIHFNANINNHDQTVFKNNDDIELNCHPNITNGEKLTKLVMKFGADKTLYTYNSTAKPEVVPGNLTEWQLKSASFANGMASLVIVKANSTKSGEFTCDVSTDKTNLQTKKLNIVFWNGTIDPQIHLKSNDTKSEIKEIKKGEAFIIECQPQINYTAKSSFSVIVKHIANKISTDIDIIKENKTHVPKNEKDGIKVEGLNNSTSIRVTDIDKKADGSYQCEYTVNLVGVGNYKISSEQKSLKVNAGTTFKLSFSLLVISLISVLRV